jgi:hypothetical protein
MRAFFRAHWKAIMAIAVLALLAMATLSPNTAAYTGGDGAAGRGAGIDAGARLRTHVAAIASEEHDTARPAQLEAAARYVENVLAADGYAVRRQVYQAGGQSVRNIEVSVSSVAPGRKPARIFMVGAHYDDNGSGTAAVLELARQLKDMRPADGTEIKFVFFVNEEPPWLGGQIRRNFIAFVGTLQSSRLVQEALSAFRAASDFPAHGLAAPDYVQGVTLSDHSSYSRYGYPAIMITDTAFLRYPYCMTGNTSAEDTPDKVDYAGVARVVAGLARTIEALAGRHEG